MRMICNTSPLTRTLILVSFLALSLPWTTLAETGNDLVQDIRDASMGFDDRRLPSALLVRFINRIQVEIATTARCNQSEATIIPSADSLEHALPSDFYQVNSAILNADPESIAPYPLPSVLTYLSPDEYGDKISFDRGRPKQYSIWGTTLRFNAFTETELDTVTLQYFALPTALTDSTSTIDLPAAYVPLLLDYLIIKCFDRLQYQGPERQNVEKRLAEKEAKLLGRPSDEL